MPDWTSDIFTPQPDHVGADFLAVPRTDVGPGGSTWQTSNGAELGSDGFDIFAVPHDPEGEARLVAECEDRKAKDQEARRQAEAERAAERAAAKTLADAQAESERLAMEARQTELEAEAASRKAAADALRAALDHQDTDFHCIQVLLSFRGETGDGTGIEEDYDFTTIWGFDEDKATDLALVAGLKAEIDKAIEPRISQYDSLGLVRADFVNFTPGGEPTEWQSGPSYYLVVRAEDLDLSPDELGSFDQVDFKLGGPLGGQLTLRPYVARVNATMLHSAATRGGVGVGQWGGEATPELAPSAGEDRDAWLARVAVPRKRLASQIARWRRSGANPDLYKAAGAATARVSRERPISWIVPGLIPRGYVSLLVGTKQAGKSTLLGEILAVVDSECQTPRSVLGTTIEARGVSCLVSGEDGIDFVASRNAYYEHLHGEAQGFVFVTAERPWPDVRKMLYAIDKVDIIGIDGLRAVMLGDEDSSGAVSQFFDEVNALAQYHGCAIILIHHLSKGVVRSLSAMLPAVRGSGAITDRVRVVVGMIDRGSSMTEIGIIKYNIPPSEAPWGQVNAGRLFRRDADTLTLIPFEAAGHDASATAGEGTSTLNSICDAISHYNRSGEVLRRTGKHELFERKWPPLAMLSRSALREGVGKLIAIGRVADGQEGLVAAQSPSDGLPK